MPIGLPRLSRIIDGGARASRAVDRRQVGGDGHEHAEQRRDDGQHAEAEQHHQHAQLADPEALRALAAAPEPQPACARSRAYAGTGRPCRPSAGASARIVVLVRSCSLMTGAGRRPSGGELCHRVSAEREWRADQARPGRRTLALGRMESPRSSCSQRGGGVARRGARAAPGRGPAAAREARPGPDGAGSAPRPHGRPAEAARVPGPRAHGRADRRRLHGARRRSIRALGHAARALAGGDRRARADLPRRRRPRCWPTTSGSRSGATPSGWTCRWRTCSGSSGRSRSPSCSSATTSPSGWPPPSRSRCSSCSTRSCRATTRWPIKADVELGGTDQTFNLLHGPRAADHATASRRRSCSRCRC